MAESKKNCLSKRTIYYMRTKDTFDLFTVGKKYTFSSVLNTSTKTVFHHIIPQSWRDLFKKHKFYNTNFSLRVMFNFHNKNLFSLFIIYFSIEKYLICLCVKCMKCKLVIHMYLRFDMYMYKNMLYIQVIYIIYM